jgi:hypothetical protein
MTLPAAAAGIFEPTTRPEPAAGQGGGPEPEPERKPARRGKKSAPAAGGKTEGMKLYLTEDVRFRLRMLAYKRNTDMSTAANDILDKALPRWELTRQG